MNMDVVYVLSQVFTVIMYILLAVTYFEKTKRKIFLFSNASLVANAIAYILLSAWTGLAMVIIAMLRNIYLIRNEKTKKITKQDWIFLIVVLIAIVVATIPAYEGFLSLFSVFATSIYTYSIWQKNHLFINCVVSRFPFFGLSTMRILSPSLVSYWKVSCW